MQRRADGFNHITYLSGKKLRTPGHFTIIPLAAPKEKRQRLQTLRMINSRDTHISLNGKKAMQGDAFVTSAGNSLKYPGDPSAPAREVINCHCVLVPDVLLPGETLEE